MRYEYSPWLNGYKGQVGTFLPNSPKPIAVQAINLDAQFAAPTANALFGNLIQTCSQAGHRGELHVHGQGAMGSALRLRLASFRRQDCDPRRLRHLL